MNRIESKGPNILPYGMPCDIGRASDTTCTRAVCEHYIVTKRHSKIAFICVNNNGRITYDNM